MATDKKKHRIPHGRATRRAALRERAHEDAAPKKVAPKKAVPKKAPPKKVAPKKAVPKKAPPKKVAPKKAPPKKVAPKKAPPKKVAPKKAPPKKAPSKKVAPKKTAPKKVAPKKVAPKKAVPKKAVVGGALERILAKSEAAADASSVEVRASMDSSLEDSFNLLERRVEAASMLTNDLQSREEPWKLATFALGAILILIAFAIATGNLIGGGPSSSSPFTQEDIAAFTTFMRSKGVPDADIAQELTLVGVSASLPRSTTIAVPRATVKSTSPTTSPTPTTTAIPVDEKCEAFIDPPRNIGEGYQLTPRTTNEAFCCGEGRVHILQFTSPSCPYCDAQEPVLKELERELEGRLILETLCVPSVEGDRELCEQRAGSKDAVTAAERLKTKYELTGTPTLIINCKYKRSGTLALSKGTEMEKEEIKRLVCALLKDKPAACTPKDVLPAPPVEIHDMGGQWCDPAGKLSIMAFYDYKCPYSERAHATLKEVLPAFGDSISIVYRNFPLPFHTGAEKIAAAAACVADQGRSEAFAECAFKGYFTDNKDTAADDTLEACAVEAGVDIDTYAMCLETGRGKSVVEDDMKAAAGYGILGTPSLVMGCTHRFSGAYPAEYFTVVLCHLLGDQGKALEPCMKVSTKNIVEKDVLGPYELLPGRDSCHEQGKIKLEMYIDFMCPYSNQAFGTLQALRKEMPTIIELNLRTFPLPFHTNAEVIAQAAVCSIRQGVDTEFAQSAFDAYFKENMDTTDPSVLNDIVSDLGLDMGEYSSCVGDATIGDVIQAEVDLAKELAITGTPAFIVDCDKKLVGALPREMFLDAFCLLFEESERPELCTA